MGQSSSMNLSPTRTASLSGGGGGRRRSFRSPFVRRKKHKQPLSAAFQAPNANGFDALNINSATVEQVSLILVSLTLYMLSIIKQSKV